MKLDGERNDVDIALSDEAIDWLVRLHSGRATAKDHAGFAAWRKQSGKHERAALEAETIWHGLGIAGERTRRAERKATRAKLARRAVLGGMALAATGLALQRSGLVGPRLFADHATGIGEQRTVTLADGSTAFLNASTALSVDFAGTARRLILHAGEASFTVARDPDRPFVVEADGGWTRAIGTVFNIDIRPGEVVVTVLDGVVEVATKAEAVMARADQRVRYTASGAPSPAESIDADMETAWRRRKLIFNRRPLGDVVAEIERHQGGRIVIASQQLRALEVTGVFDLSEPEAILRAIEETLPVRVTRLPFLTVIR